MTRSQQWRPRPTLGDCSWAHAATKQIVRAQLAGGTRAADEATPLISGALFATEDLKNAVASFLTDGPGKAVYTGR